MKWIANNLPLIGDRLVDHLALALPAIILSLVLSIPLGWLANRFARTRGLVLSVAGLFYAIPSLALFFAIPAIIGTGLRDPLNMTVGLTVYGVALMVRSTADGLSSVDPDVIQSATAMGYSPRERFWKVELPLAGPVLLAGLRVVSVSTISLTTVGAVIGVASLGSLFTDGFGRNIQAEVWTGLLLTIGVAIILDLVIVQLGRIVMPWTRRARSVATSRHTAKRREVAAS